MAHIHRSIAITDRSSVGEARRAAMAAAQSLGFDTEKCSDIGIAATEAANNILLHAQSGELLVCPGGHGEAVWLDLLAVDSGPGIRDVSRALEDGFSTIGTAGQGLGAMERLSDIFSLYSLPERGTVVLSGFRSGRTSQARRFGAINIPVRGETLCGDSYLAMPGEARSLYMVVDGLGHGVAANEAAMEAVTTVREAAQENLTEIVTRTHDALKKTRGAAMSIAIVDHERLLVKYAGVGNISASLANGAGSRSMVSQNGTLGAVLPHVQEFTYPFDGDTMLLMFSDGLNSKCAFTGYPGLRSRPPSLIAGLLYRDFSRKRDDATVLIASLGGAPA